MEARAPCLLLRTRPQTTVTKRCVQWVAAKAGNKKSFKFKGRCFEESSMARMERFSVGVDGSGAFFYRRRGRFCQIVRYWRNRKKRRCRADTGRGQRRRAKESRSGHHVILDGSTPAERHALTSIFRARAGGFTSLPAHPSDFSMDGGARIAQLGSKKAPLGC